MLWAVRREAMQERERLDEQQERDLAAEESPEERLALALEISELVRAIGEAAEARWLETSAEDLADKARVCARPLRLVATK